MSYHLIQRSGPKDKPQYRKECCRKRRQDFPRLPGTAPGPLTEACCSTIALRWNARQP